MIVLSVAVHPDDETLGCGGALLKHSRAGDSLHWLILTKACAPDYSEQEIERQRRQVDAVRHAYPFETVDWLSYCTAKLEAVPLRDLAHGIQDAVDRLRPGVVYIPHRSDAHSDHRMAFEALQAVFKTFHVRSRGLQRLLSCEVLSETEAAFAKEAGAFAPNTFVDIGDVLERKLEIMGLYISEVQTGHLPRSASSIRALARYRGAALGIEYAEAFMTLLDIR